MTKEEEEAAAKAAADKAAADKKAADEAAAAKAAADADAKLGDAGKAAIDAERKSRREAEKRAKDAEAKLKAIEDADASELEKATKRAEEAEARVNTLTESVRKANLVAAFGDPKHALVDASAAAALASGVEYDEDGLPTNVDKLVTDLTGRYAFLKGTPAAPKPGEINAGGGAGGGGGGGGPALTAEELATAQSFGMTAEDYAAAKHVNYTPAAAKT